MIRKLGLFIISTLFLGPPVMAGSSNLESVKPVACSEWKQPTDADFVTIVGKDKAVFLDRVLDVLEKEVVPRTEKGVREGNKLFGAAILNKSDLSTVIATTNAETGNPLFHGEVTAIFEYTFEGGNRNTENPYYVCLNLSPDGSSLTTAGTKCRGNQGNNQNYFDIQFQGGTRPDSSSCNGNASFSDNIQVSGGSFTKSFNNGWVDILVNGTISGSNASGTARADSFGGVCSVNWQAQLP